MDVIWIAKRVYFQETKSIIYTSKKKKRKILSNNSLEFKKNDNISILDIEFSKIIFFLYLHIIRFWKDRLFDRCFYPKTEEEKKYIERASRIWTFVPLSPYWQTRRMIQIFKRANQRVENRNFKFLPDIFPVSNHKTGSPPGSVYFTSFFFFSWFYFSFSQRLFTHVGPIKG